VVKASDAMAGAAMAAGIIEAIDFPTSIFIERGRYDVKVLGNCIMRVGRSDSMRSKQ
jgi:hypothetical protein